jgi:AraC-like DNA-binding protein
VIRFRKYYPHPKLAEHIQSYFLIDADPSVNLNTDYEKDFLNNHPQGTIDLMFALRGGIKLANYKGDEFSLSQIFVMAQQEGFFKIDFAPDIRIAGVVFYAESFTKLFNFSMSELTNKGCDVQDDLSETYLELHERLCNTHFDDNLFGEINHFFIRELASSDYSFTKFDRLIRWMRMEGEQKNIGELASMANMSEKTLQRHMKKVTGVTPKSFGNILRFNSVLKLIDSSEELDWQDILFRSGYYDQAHFIKDFKRFTGLTPTEFMKENETLSKLFLKD